MIVTYLKPKVKSKKKTRIRFLRVQYLLNWARWRRERGTAGSSDAQHQRPAIWQVWSGGFHPLTEQGKIACEAAVMEGTQVDLYTALEYEPTGKQR